MLRSLLFVALLAVSVAQAQPVERGAPLPRKTMLGAQLQTGEGTVSIVSVMPGLTAEALGLKARDTLLEINGKAVKSPTEIGAAMRGLAAGDRVEVKIRREGKEVTLSGRAQPRPKQTEDGMTVLYDQVKVGDRRIRVIITHPNGKGPFPTVMLVGGIGAYSVDASFATMPYGNIIGPIARAGYATVRIDKPGQGDSEGPMYTDLLFDDELAAYVGGLRLAKTLPVIDKDRIAIFGHSMGGCFGPMIAQQEPFRALAVSGTVAKSWTEYTIENSRRQILLGGTSAAELEEFMPQVVAATYHLFQLGLSPAEIKEKHPSVAPAVAELVPDGKTFSGVGLPFFQQLAKKNMAAAWAEFKGPVLAAYGENDFLSSEADHEYLVSIVNRERPGTATYVRLKNADHGFFRTTSQRDSMEKWGRPGGQFNPEIVTVLSEWLGKSLK